MDKKKDKQQVINDIKACIRLKDIKRYYRNRSVFLVSIGTLRLSIPSIAQRKIWCVEHLWKIVMYVCMNVDDEYDSYVSSKPLPIVILLYDHVKNMNMEQIKESLHYDQFEIVHTITLKGKSVHDYRKFDVFMQEGWKMSTRTFTYIPTFPPFANIASACALPIPLAAPVIIATLPSIFISAAACAAAATPAVDCSYCN